MLYGNYQHNIDKKGRVFIPAKLREELGESFMIYRGINGKRCLCVCSIAEWDILVAKISKLPDAKANDLKRFLFGGTFNVEFDTQGRILVTGTLREHARLEGEAQMIGMGSYLEIWSNSEWDEVNAGVTLEDIGDIARELEL